MKQIISNFKKQKTVFLLSICSLTLGIMVAIVVGLWSLHELSFDQFHANNDRIYRIITNFNFNDQPVSMATTFQPFGSEAKENIAAVEDACRVYIRKHDIQIDNVTHPAQRIFIADQNFFSFFSFPLKEGLPEHVLSTPDRVVVSEYFAKKYFSQQNPIGQVVRYGNINFTVSGIMKDMPKNSSLQADFVFPLHGMFARALWSGDNSCNAFLLLREGRKPEEIIGQLEQMLLPVFGCAGEDAEACGFSVSLELLTDMYFNPGLMNEFIEMKGSKSLIFILALTAFIILVISCINFANIFVSTSFIRAKMIGIKKCFGAGKIRLISEFYFETACYVIVSVILGLLLAVLVMPVFNNFTQSDLIIDFTSPRLYFLLAAIFAAMVLLAGSYPALYMTRFDVIETLSGKFKGRQASVFQRSLTVFQFAASIALLIVVAFMQKQVNYLISFDLGFDTENVVYVHGRSGFNSNFDAFKSEILTTEPSIIDITRGPLPVFLLDRWSVTNTSSDNQHPIMVDVHRVSPNYFDFMGMEFTDNLVFQHETWTSNEVVLNESAAKLLGLNNSAGEIINVGGSERTVMGVIRDAYTKSLHQAIEPQIYIRIPDNQAWSVIFFKTTGNTQRAVNFIEQKWKEREAGFPFEYHFLDEAYKQLYQSEMNAGRVFIFTMFIALIITVAGLFAMTIYATRRRVREIALRRVHGATIKDIFVLLNKGFLLMVVIAFVIACPVAYYGLDRWLDNFAVKTPLSAWVFILVGVATLLITLLTTGYQTWRAARENPVAGLKGE